MPLTDDNGDGVDKGNTIHTTRTVSVDSATTTVSMSDLISVTEIHGARFAGTGQVSAANDEAVEVVAGTGSNEVDVEIYTPDGAGALTNSAPAASRDVEIAVEGY